MLCGVDLLVLFTLQSIDTLCMSALCAISYLCKHLFSLLADVAKLSHRDISTAAATNQIVPL